MPDAVTPEQLAEEMFARIVTVAYGKGRKHEGARLLEQLAEVYRELKAARAVVGAAHGATNFFRKAIDEYDKFLGYYEVDVEDVEPLFEALTAYDAAKGDDNA